MKVHKGDTVLVIAGKDKGAKGKVLQAYPERNRVLVEGVNRIKKHTAQSANERGASSGGIVTQAPSVSSATRFSTLPVSNASANRPAISRSKAECGSRARSRAGGVFASSVARARWSALLIEVSVVSSMAATSAAR